MQSKERTILGGGGGGEKKIPAKGALKQKNSYTRKNNVCCIFTEKSNLFTCAKRKCCKDKIF